MEIKVVDILKFLKSKEYQYNYIGKEYFSISNYASISNIKNNCISWIKNESYFQKIDFNNLLNVLLVVDKSIIIDPKMLSNLSLGIIQCDKPKQIFFTILNHYFSNNSIQNYISDTAIIESNNISNNVYIGHNSYVGKDVVIRDNVVIMNNVSIEGKVFIDEGSIIHSGVVIGSDGFGYYKDNRNLYEKVPHFGGVRIGKNVEIGANTCIDKGTLDDTVIEDNVKIDNLCHIGHNVIIESNSLIIAMSMIGGSAYLKSNSYIAPGAIIANQAVIGENSLVGLGSVVLKNVESNSVMAGVPAKMIRENKVQEDRNEQN